MFLNKTVISDRAAGFSTIRDAALQSQVLFFNKRAQQMIPTFGRVL